MQFILVEYPDDKTPMPDFTRTHPGATIDIIAEPAQPIGKDDLMHPCVALVHAEPWAAVEQLVALLHMMYESVETLQRDPRAGRWVGRMRIRESTFRHTATYQVMQFQKSFGAPWVHLEGGVIHIRARVPDERKGIDLAAEMRTELDRLGIPAQLEVREIGVKDYGVWQELVQYSLGMA